MSEGALILPDETHAPRLSAAQAATLMADVWGQPGAVATELGSYQDQVFQIVGADGTRVALKCANTSVGRDVIAMEHAALRHLTGRLGGLLTPQPVDTPDGDDIVVAHGHLARVLSWVPGTPLALSGFIDAPRARALGDAAGQLSAALTNFSHDAAARPLQWDVRRAADVAASAREYLTGDEWAMQQRALGWLADVDDAALPRQVAYTDISAHNLLGALAPDGTFTPTAIVDFGDLVDTWRLADAAGAACSAVAGDPGRALALALASLTAFHARQPLTEAEVDAFWPVLAARAAICAASSAHQIRRGAAATPETAAYHGAFGDRDSEALQAILAVDPVLARSAARAACALPVAAHSSGALIAALSPGPLLAQPARPLRPIDLSAGSPLLTTGSWDDADAIAEVLADAADAADAEDVEDADGAAAVVSRWLEARLIGAGTPSEDAPRSLHLGADVFAAAATGVLAPFDACVLSATDRSVELQPVAPQDTPIVRLAGLRPTVKAGATVARGEAIGVLHQPANAELLPPHLHVQLALSPGMPGLGDPALRAVWAVLCPDPSPLLGVNVAAPAPPTAVQQRERRAQHVARPQHLYYREPTQIVRGWRQYLYDADGRPFLDMVNNVASIGHAHPAVTEAATRQFQLLNTNSRFLYDAIADYAEAITATLPPHLDTVFFVNSGSEAVDLAVRLARTATGRHDLLAIQGAYHGWTGSLFEFCTHPQDNPRWPETTPPWIHPVAQPNPYRSPIGADGQPMGTSAAPYVDAVRAQCEAAHGRGGVAAFVAEPLLGNQGAVTPPPGYLAAAYRVVREHGGLCIADEIQVGYGRSGDTFWAFEYEGVDPDIVTAAKAVGNGHPLGFVACRRDIADAFGAHAPWFSSPGGGAVSCRIGLAVLQTLHGEALQRNAAVVGTHLKTGLQTLAHRHPVIGQVHGRGLYLGVDLVLDRATLEPAAGAASAICERLRRYGVILQPTGDHDNVLKIKPPLCLTERDADFVVAQLSRVLDERARAL